MASCDVRQALLGILSRMENAFDCRAKIIVTAKPLLVAVSKTKPVTDVIEAYSAGQRHFGENYVQELVQKSSNSQILKECNEIKWHFIGHLQTNKINKLLKCTGLYMIETVDSQKLANNLNDAWGELDVPDKHPLRVLVQVNVSDEDVKSGVKPEEASKLYQYIRENLQNLSVEGVMAIGKVHDCESDANADFLTLMRCHEEIYKKFNLDPTDVHVSMGMSNDFEQAIKMGSTIVRVGSSIFGTRLVKM